MNYVIWQPWGGLGDNLQFSTLPEQLSSQGHSVYLHHQNAVRNEEILKIAWGHNPFLKGTLGGSPNCGWIGVDPGGGRTPDPKCPIFGINKWERLFGAPLSMGIPKIYWTPPRTEGLEKVVLVDLNYSSCTYLDHFVLPTVYREIAARWPGADVRQVNFKKQVSTKAFKSDFQPIEVHDIYHYCSLIASCRAIVTLLSGSSPLASAVRGFNCNPEILTIKKTDYKEGQIFPNAEFVDAH